MKRLFFPVSRIFAGRSYTGLIVTVSHSLNGITEEAAAFCGRKLSLALGVLVRNVFLFLILTLTVVSHYAPPCSASVSAGRRTEQAQILNAQYYANFCRRFPHVLFQVSDTGWLNCDDIELHTQLTLMHKTAQAELLIRSEK